MRFQVSVDDPDSGAAVTFATMRELAPPLQSASMVSTKAALIVQRPNARSQPVKVLLDNPDHYRIASVTEADVGNAQLPDGSVVYSFERVKLGKAAALEAETLCTRGLLLASKEKLGRDMRSRIQGFSRTRRHLGTS